MDLTTNQHPSFYAGCRGVEFEIQPIFQPLKIQTPDAVRDQTSNPLAGTLGRSGLHSARPIAMTNASIASTLFEYLNQTQTDNLKFGHYPHEIEIYALLPLYIRESLLSALFLIIRAIVSGNVASKRALLRILRSGPLIKHFIKFV